MHHISRQNASSIHYLPSLNCVYLNNPKAGCSTVRTSLWTAHDTLTGTKTFQGTPHRKEGSPFVSQPQHLAKITDELRSATWFSVVRNPYTRALSAYLDKFRKNGDPNVIRPFRSRYGWTPERHPTFSEFLHIIAQDSPESLDHHFRPQSHMLLLPYTPIDYIGYVEQMDEAERWMNQMCSAIAVTDHRPHATGASNKVLENYDPATIALAQQLYHDDFEAFGYSLDPESPMPTPTEVTRSDVALDFLSSMVGTETDRREAFGRLDAVLDPRPPWLAQHAISTGLESNSAQAVEMARTTPDCSWRTSKTLGMALAGINDFHNAQVALHDAERRYLPAFNTAQTLLGEPTVELSTADEPTQSTAAEAQRAGDPSWFYSASFNREEIEAEHHRIATGGNWDTIGKLQIDWLTEQGLKPKQRLLDLGCGPLRGGVHLVAFLDPGNYYGIDVNPDLLEAGYNYELANLGLQDRLPRENLHHTDDFDASTFGTEFDVVFVQSVLTHLSLSQARLAIVQSAKSLAADGSILATYFRRSDDQTLGGPVTHASGVVTSSQAEPFDYRDADLTWIADAAGLVFESLGEWGHPAGQLMARFTHRR